MVMTAMVFMDRKLNSCGSSGLEDPQQVPDIGSLLPKLDLLFDGKQFINEIL